MNLLDQMAKHIREFQQSGEGMGALYRDLETYDNLKSLEAVATLTVSAGWGPRINIDAENAVSKLPPGEYLLYAAPTDVAAYRQLQESDAERLVKQYAHQRTQWDSSVIAMLEAMKDVHAVIRIK